MKFINVLFAIIVLGVIGVMVYVFVLNPKATKSSYKPKIQTPATQQVAKLDDDLQSDQTFEVEAEPVVEEKPVAVVEEKPVAVVEEKPVAVVEEKPAAVVEMVKILLRDGSTIRGEVKNKTTKHLVLLHENGLTNIKWRVMHTNSFAKIHPTLYNSLVSKMQSRIAQKEAEMREKGLVKFKGKWMSKEDMLYNKYKFVDQRVIIKDGGESAFTGNSSSLSRERFSMLQINFKGLDPKLTYKLEVEFKTELESTSYSYNSSGNSSTSTRDGKIQSMTKSETISGKEDFEVIYKQPGFFQFKSENSNRRSGNSIKKQMAIVKLDGEVIFKKTFESIPEYFIIDDF